MAVRHALLGILAQRPSHGYDLHASLMAMVGGRTNWDVKPSQVYTTLSRLEESGLILQTALRRAGGPDQRIYEITPAGREELESWYAEGVHPPHLRDEFFLKLMFAASDPACDASEVIRTQRSALYKSLHELTTRRGRTDRREELSQALLIDKAIMHVEADLRWLDMAEARLRQIEAQPAPAPSVRRRGRPPKAQLIADPDPPRPIAGDDI